MTQQEWAKVRRVRKAKDTGKPQAGLEREPPEIAPELTVQLTDEQAEVFVAHARVREQLARLSEQATITREACLKILGVWPAATHNGIILGWVESIAVGERHTLAHIQKRLYARAPQAETEPPVMMEASAALAGLERARLCAECGAPIHDERRYRYCSDRCRKQHWHKTQGRLRGRGDAK